MPSANVPAEHVLSKLSAIITHDMPPIKAALTYAEHGLPVFPCRAIDKKPLTKHGFKDATTDPDVVRAWWKKWPLMSIGSPTGLTMDAFVFDVDRPKGPRVLQEMEAIYGQLPTTLEQQTGGLGRQLFFAMPPQVHVGNSASKLGKNLDVRGTGGYVILPPSGHLFGGTYRWHNGGAPLLEAPGWLLTLLANKSKAVQLAQAQPVVSCSRTTPYGNRAFQEETARVAAALPGSRNDTLNQSAFALGQLVGGGEIDRYDVESALLAAAQQAGLSSSEAQKTLQSGLAAGERSPRQAPPQRSNEPRNVREATAPVAAVRNTPHFFSRLPLDEYIAGALMAKPLAPLSWLLKDSLLSGTVGFVCGAPGVGKSTFLLQLAASVATGHPFFGNYLVPGGKGKALVFFAEEDDRVLVRRTKTVLDAARVDQRWGALSNTEQQDLEQNLILIPAAGEDLRLVEASGGSFRESEAFTALLDKAKSIPGLSLIVLDPLSRYYGVNENDNTMTTTFCQLLERLAKETGATVICCHHTSKGAGQIGGKFNLHAALGQDAMRGASGLTGAARWQLNIVRLPANTAREYIDDPQAAEGNYLAAQVCKKNYGPPEDKFFMSRGPEGILLPVEKKWMPESDLEEVLKNKVESLIQAVEEAGEKPMTMKQVSDVFPGRWQREGLRKATKPAVRQAISAAIMEGRLFEVQVVNPGNHKQVKYLATTPSIGGSD